VVGHRLFHRRYGNFHTHNHQHARNCLWRKSRISAARAGLPSRASDSLRGSGATIFPGGILYCLSAPGEAFRHENEVSRGGCFPWHAGARGRCANFGDWEGGECRVRHRNLCFDLDHHDSHDVLYVRGRDARGHLDGCHPVCAVPGRFGCCIFSAAAQNSRRLAGSDPSRRCGGR